MLENKGYIIFMLAFLGCEKVSFIYNFLQTKNMEKNFNGMERISLFDEMKLQLILIRNMIFFEGSLSIVLM